MTDQAKIPSLARPAAATVERAAQFVLAAGLRDRASAFSPGKAIWSREHLDELVACFVTKPDLTGLSFEEKLALQLEGASDGAIQLLAELYYLNVLPLSNYKGATKRSLIHGMLDLMTAPAGIPEELADALDAGVFNGGVAFGTRRYWQLCLLVAFTREFFARPDHEQKEALDDPLKFRAILDGVTKFNEPAQRHSLLYLAHPTYFMPIVSGKHRRQIRAAFADRIAAPSGDLDHDLHAIRQAIGDVDLYLPPWHQQWDPQAHGQSESSSPAARVSEDGSSSDDELIADATDDLATDLNIRREALQEWIELLRDRPQLIFYGPPGTGKTFIAQRLAQHIAGENITIVQFHPSTSYEDFFEGYRPTSSDDGTVAFRLKDGPLRKVVREAVKDGQQQVPHVLIIDEINRGNLARIFGELYFLLEYRDSAVELLYARDDDPKFLLPKNIIILGTMNTADRSIALVDSAMRRRFAFVGLRPDSPPVDRVLRAWLEDHRPDHAVVADMLQTLNERIDDRDFRIGPSYFMRDAVYRPGGLERVWRTAIIPLLEEHHYGQNIDVQSRYGFQAILKATARDPVGSLDEANNGATADAN